MSLALEVYPLRHHNNISIGSDVCFPSRLSRSNNQHQHVDVAFDRTPADWLELFEDEVSEVIDQLTETFQTHVSNTIPICACDTKRTRKRFVVILKSYHIGFPNHLLLPA